MSLFSLVLIFPFLVLTVYINPSIDDYAFPYYVLKLGFWEAQTHWYLTWTGKYASMFLLSFHPLLFNSLFLYKLVAGVMAFATVFSLYRFIVKVFLTEQKLFSIILSILFSFLFFNGMPDITQGIYWLPRVIIYHFSNILTLYVLTNILESLKIESRKRCKIINCFLIVVLCGLNETIMVVFFVLIGLIFLWNVLEKKTLNFTLLLYELIALISSLVVVFAPGNMLRGGGFDWKNKGLPVYDNNRKETQKVHAYDKSWGK